MQNKEIKIRGFHLDQFGHVNNVRYPELLEEARYDFFDQFPGFFARVAQTGHFLPITETHIFYRRPAFLDDRLEIQTRISQVGETSGTIHQIVRLKGTEKIILEADVLFVAADLKTGRRAPIAGDLHTEIAAIMQRCEEK